jgi:hypothetical protein
MDIQFEQRVLQNPLLSGLVMWRYVRAYYDATNQSDAPDLRTSLLVLPMALHKRTVGVIHRMHKTSGLAKALTDDPFIRVGLQERVDGFTDLSFRAIHVACCARLLAMDKTGRWPCLVPTSIVRNAPTDLAPSSEDARSMLRTAERLGLWFAGMDFDTLCLTLNIDF